MLLPCILFDVPSPMRLGSTADSRRPYSAADKHIDPCPDHKCTLSLCIDHILKVKQMFSKRIHLVYSRIRNYFCNHSPRIRNDLTGIDHIRCHQRPADIYTVPCVHRIQHSGCPRCCKHNSDSHVMIPNSSNRSGIDCTGGRSHLAGNSIDRCDSRRSY